MTDTKQESELSDEEFYETDDLEQLHTAIVNNELDMLEEACQNGADINGRFSDYIDPQHFDMTPLSLAAALDRVEHVKVLLDHGAEVNTTFANLKTTALMTASFHGHTDVVRLLLESGANPKDVDLQGSTALGYCFGGSRTVDVVSLLLSSGVDVNQKNMLGMNAILLVAGYGNDLLVRMVIESGANANSMNDFGHSALHLAVVGKRSLIAAASSGHGRTSLYGLNRHSLDHVLVDWVQGHKELVGNSNSQIDDKDLTKAGQFMMDIGQKMEEPDSFLCTDDQDAMKKRLDAVLRYHSEKMQSLKDSKKSGVVDTLLSCGGRRSKKVKTAAAAAGNSSSSSAPLNRPAESSRVSTDVDHDVAAICNRCARIVRLIIDSGCNVNKVEDAYGLTALDMALLMGDIESTALLLAAGGDLDHLMKLLAMTELYQLIVMPNKKKLKDLLNNNQYVDVNSAFMIGTVERFQNNSNSDNALDGDEGLTPLAVAAKAHDNSTVDIIKLLVKKSADINKIGPGGRSPLGEASRWGNKKMVEFLLNQNAKLEIPNSAFKNATPVVVAVMSKQSEIVQFLISNGAKIDTPMTDGRTSLIKALDADDMPMIDTLLGNGDLEANFSDRTGFMYQVAEKYQQPNRDIESILHAIRQESKSHEMKDKEAMSSTGKEENHDKSKPIGVTYYKQKKTNIPNPQYHKGDEDEDDDENGEEEDEDSNEPPPPQYKPPPLPEIPVLTKYKPRKPPSVDSSDSSTDKEDESKIPNIQKNIPSVNEATKVMKRPKGKMKNKGKCQVMTSSAAQQPSRNPKASSSAAPLPLQKQQNDDSEEVTEQVGEEVQDDDSAEEEPKLQLATTAPLSGVVRIPPMIVAFLPSQEPPLSRVKKIKVIKTSNNLMKQTTVTKTARVQPVDSDSEEEKEKEDVMENKQKDDEQFYKDQNKNIAKPNKQKKSLVSMSLNNSTEIDTYDTKTNG